MKSSSGEYYPALDHLRALAAFMVFSWHFSRVEVGTLPQPSTLPLGPFLEGHTGVALFMTLSGYLFAKLLNDSQIDYAKFWWNRVLRLLPMLALMLLLVGLRDHWGQNSGSDYLRRILAGIYKPVWPNGGWSITVEFHFYIILPVLLLLAKRGKALLPLCLMTAVAARGLYVLNGGEIQHLAYYTIAGRIDQFLLGILAYRYSSWIAKRHRTAIVMGIVFTLFYSWFHAAGGFNDFGEGTARRHIWVLMPTIEGLAYGWLIAWYDRWPNVPTGRLSRFIATTGVYSYSIYLLHFFFVDALYNAIDTFLVEIQTVPQALVFSIPCFLMMFPVGYLCHRFVERPFLTFRKPYRFKHTEPPSIP